MSNTCPHCGALLRVALYLQRPPAKAKRLAKWGQFQHSVPFQQPPSSTLGQLWWFLRGKGPNIPIPPKKTLRSEISTYHHTRDRYELLISEAQIDISTQQIKDLARCYAGTGRAWSRASVIECIGCSQTFVHNLNRALVKLKYLEPVNPTKYRLTEAGQAWLCQFLEGRPSVFPLSGRSG